MTPFPEPLPRVVSASRRTDIPAFHAQWFLGRVRAGHCHWVHPYTARVGRVSLAAADVLAIVFWTRQPSPLLRHLEALRTDGFTMLFQFTITGYGPPIETHNPELRRQLEVAEELARRLGPDAVLWRYDPILLADDLPPPLHEDRFARLAARLEGVTRRCTISFVDFYGKTTRNLARVEEERGVPFRHPDVAEKRSLARRLASIAAARGITLRSCCDDALLGEGVVKSRCVDPAAIRAVRGKPIPRLAVRPTRRDCGCVESVDVGAYDTCGFGCRYCYAVSGRSTALRRLREADPADSLLWRPPGLRGVDLEAFAETDAPLAGGAPVPSAGEVAAGKTDERREEPGSRPPTSPLEDPAIRN